MEFSLADRGTRDKSGRATRPDSEDMSSEDRRDRDRLRRLASGDAKALAELYDAHAARLFRLAAWLTRSRSDGEDVVQDVMVKLASMGPDLLAIARPAPYLLRMARTRALDTVARKGRHVEELEDEGMPSPARRDDERVAVEEALQGLEPAQREAVYLHACEGLTFREIGAATGVSTFTAASRYRLGLRKVRARLGVTS